MGGERVERAGFEGDALQPVASFEDVRWLLTRGALEGRDVRLSLANTRGGYPREVRLPLAQLEAQDADEELFRRIGIVAPFSRAVIGRVNAGGAADRAGLRQGDVVVRIDGREIVDGRQVVELVRASVKGSTSIPADWQIERNGLAQTISVSPDVIKAGDRLMGRIDAYVAAPPELVTVNYGPLDGLWLGAVRTWDLSLFTLRMMGKMVIGDLSLKNLSGPLTIADYAGRSASMGLVQYLGFLALISVSLGVLNLLPLPVLDGGHLMYYLWEGLTGKSVSDVWLERLQRVGVAVLAAMMSIALFNDLTRLWG
jgi:regulator of sigma E protease